MPTVRLSAAQKDRLEEGKRLLEGIEGRNLTHGAAVAEMARLVLRHRELLATEPDAARDEIDGDSLLDPELVFDMGPTAARTVDRLLFGRR